MERLQSCRHRRAGLLGLAGCRGAGKPGADGGRPSRNEPAGWASEENTQPEGQEFVGAFRRGGFVNGGGGGGFRRGFANGGGGGGGFRRGGFANGGGGGGFRRGGTSNW